MIPRSSKRTASSSGNFSAYNCLKYSLFLGVIFTLSSTLYIYKSLGTVGGVDEAVGADPLTIQYGTHLEAQIDEETNIEHIRYLKECNSGITFTGLSGSVVNDNFCDCSDGMDEYKTAACSFLLAGQKVFQCSDSVWPDGTDTLLKYHSAGDDENEDDDGNFIFASRVDDGVCDCNDCSDESTDRRITFSSDALHRGLNFLRGRSKLLSG